MKRKNNRRAFTIVELVIVIAVIAILATVLVPTFGDVITKAQDSKALQEAKNAYTEYLIEAAGNGNVGSYIVYQADANRFVAIKDGSVVGVYSTQAEALSVLVGEGADASLLRDSGDGKLFIYNGGSTQTTWNADLNHIIFYGQSFSTGSDAPYYSDPTVDGVYVYGKIDNSQNGTELVPLNSASINNQHPVISTSNVLAQMLAESGYKTNLVLGSYGAGGQSIAQLMSDERRQEIKNEEGYTYDCESSERYDVFVNSVNAIATYAQANEQSVKCPVIVFLQGERDYYTDAELEKNAYATGSDKDKYKQYMSRLKDDMQKEVMAAYGQSEKPLFIIYQVSGAYVKNNSEINMAQIEFAQENADVVLAQTPYFTSHYTSSGHLTQNGYRWMGEYIAKYAYAAMVEGKKPWPMLYSTIECVTDNTVRIHVSGAEGGLSIDTFTVEDATNAKNLYGFNLIVNEKNVVPTNVAVTGDEILLTLPESTKLLSANSISVQYAGSQASGSGNIRDNCSDLGYYEYLDDSADKGKDGSLSISHSSKDASGNSIIGKKYPLYNWLASFSYDLKTSDTPNDDTTEEDVKIGTLTPFESFRGYVKNGPPITTDGGQYSQKYYVIPGTTGYYSGTVRGSANYSVVSFFDADNNYLGNSGLISDGTETLYTNHEFTVPEGAAYMICTAYKDNIVVVGSYRENPILTGTLTPFESFRGYVKNGPPITTDGGQYSQKYYVIPGTTGYYSGTVRGSANYSVVSFFDADNNYLGSSGLISDGTETLYTNHEFTVPEGAAYMICTAYKNDIVVVGAYYAETMQP